MTRTARLQVESLDDRLTPSVTIGRPDASNCFVAADAHITPGDPCRTHSPVLYELGSDPIGGCGGLDG
jgi:hypothetical protein